MTPPKKGGLALLISAKPKDDEAAEPMPDDEMAEGEAPSQSTEPEAEEDDGKQYLTVPKSFRPPDDKQMGQEFTTTIRAKMDEDGRVCVTAIGDIPMDGSEASPEESDEETGENPNSADESAQAPSNSQNEGGAIESTPHVKESKKLKALLRG